MDDAESPTADPIDDGPSADPRLGETVVAEADLRIRIDELGAQITADYVGRSLLLVGVLKGAFMFMADLSRAIDRPIEVDFMAVSSYGSATKTSGIVRIVKDLDLDLKGRDVLVVEDIVDSGLTLKYLLKNLWAREPASLEVCALLRKDCAAPMERPLRYIGFEVPDDFVVGYGLDAAEQYRHLRSIRRYLEPEDNAFP
jgi:hypoxanthine phosphoribosyltransferase